MGLPEADARARPPPATGSASRPDEDALAAVDLAPVPAIDDPMLAPVPSAPRDVSSLDEALSLVRAQSTDLRVAYLEIERAAAQSRIALAGLLPTINGLVSATHNFLTADSQILIGANGLTPITQTVPVPTPNFLSAQASLTEPVVNVRSWNVYETSRGSERVAQLSLEEVRRSIALNVANALVAVVAGERVAELNRAGLRGALERLELARRKRSLGGSTALDVSRTQEDVQSARATLVTGDEALRKARDALGLALGFSRPFGVSRGLSLGGLERAALGACTIVPTIEDRADLAGARQRVLVAKRNVEDVKLQFVPVLNAQSTLSTTTADTGSAPSTTWSIQGVLSIPVWDGGARYGLLRDANARVREAEVNLEGARRAASVQLEQAQRGVAVAESARQVAADGLASAAETERLVRIGYMGGQETSLELVTAASDLRVAEIGLALKEFDVVRARVSAILAIAACR